MTDIAVTFTVPQLRPACERRIWMHGRERDCGMEFGVTTWTDTSGRTHTACRHHLAELRHRWTPA